MEGRRATEQQELAVGTEKGLRETVTTRIRSPGHPILPPHRARMRPTTRLSFVILQAATPPAGR
jgi:hypothetical protein